MNTRAFCLLMTVLLAGCGDSNSNNPMTPSSVVNVPASATDLRIGTGDEAVNGSRLTVNYTGWLYDAAGPDNKGQQFDSGQNFQFTLGAGQVISGWEQGFNGMREGGLRRLVLPPALAYGSSGVGGVIPPNATLVFDVELVNVS